MVLAVTGHRKLPRNERLRSVVRHALERLGVELVWSMLAIGADQLVASTARGQNIPIAAVLPFSDYETDFDRADKVRFTKLRASCREVVVLPHKNRSDSAYFEAGKAIVDKGDALLAIWDGSPSEGQGGTADVVAYARQLSKPIWRIDPKAVVLEPNQ